MDDGAKRDNNFTMNGSRAVSDVELDPLDLMVICLSEKRAARFAGYDKRLLRPDHHAGIGSAGGAAGAAVRPGSWDGCVAAGGSLTCNSVSNAARIGDDEVPVCGQDRDHDVTHRAVHAPDGSRGCAVCGVRGPGCLAPPLPGCSSGSAFRSRGSIRHRITIHRHRCTTRRHRGVCAATGLRAAAAGRGSWRRGPNGGGQACYAGPYVCPMDRPIATGGNCYCLGNDGQRVTGRAN